MYQPWCVRGHSSLPSLFREVTDTANQILFWVASIVMILGALLLAFAKVGPELDFYKDWRFADGIRG